MRILVTGGSGLVGRHIARHLSDRHQVLNYDIVEASLPSVEYIAGDILDERLMVSSLSDCDAVVHCAAIVAPTDKNAAEITRVNVLGTKRVLKACEDSGIERFVFVSSDSVYGFVFSQESPRPLYFPVDELHPTSPLDPYGASKLLGEELVRAFAHRTHGAAVALRPPWVWCPEEYDKCRELTQNPEIWWKGLWAYVHVDDLARAAALSLETKMDRPFEAMLIAASDNGTDVPTPELVSEYYPNVKIATDQLDAYQSLMSCEKAKNLIDFEPSLSWRDFL
jgi:nucleoside-diphosphate-sugar epimerase